MRLSGAHVMVLPSSLHRRRQSYREAWINHASEGYACGRYFQSNDGLLGGESEGGSWTPRAIPRMTVVVKALPGAVMSVLLIGPMSRCANCRRIPSEGRRWPHVAGGDWFCSLDCLYGLHPELEEGDQ
jgi:hypothetical protein